jgi:hypothetical protein
MRATSKRLNIFPSGFDVSQRICARNPVSSATVSISSRIVVGTPLERLILSLAEHGAAATRITHTHRARKKSRTGAPEIQATISASPHCLASTNLRIVAGMT